jgi:hypothetical protein
MFLYAQAGLTSCYFKSNDYGNYMHINKIKKIVNA